MGVGNILQYSEGIMSGIRGSIADIMYIAYHTILYNMCIHISHYTRNNIIHSIRNVLQIQTYEKQAHELGQHYYLCVFGLRNATYSHVPRDWSVVQRFERLRRVGPDR